MLDILKFLQVEMGRGLGSGGEKGLTMQGLHKAGYESIFVGIGLPDSKVAPIFEGLTLDNGSTPPRTSCQCYPWGASLVSVLNVLKVLKKLKQELKNSMFSSFIKG